MTLNITLFIQVLNFLATYAFLHHFFFKPILLRLKEKELAAAKAQQTLATQKDVMLKTEKAKKAAVVDFQTKVQRTYTVPRPQAPQAELDFSYRREENEVEVLVKKATNLIVEKVPHVD